MGLLDYLMGTEKEPVKKKKLKKKVGKKRVLEDFDISMLEKLAKGKR